MSHEDILMRLKYTFTKLYSCIKMSIKKEVKCVAYSGFSLTSCILTTLILNKTVEHMGYNTRSYIIIIGDIELLFL